ncbi:hypothetical protein W97_03332 [Coniosporium apollinis CBS 100218]|uniref:Enhancer of mRNA-decapping protein 3 n=1 Tax=Coniosporium apollinis (strain CBS 100218) TaxID=1168221 RepID=R7YQE6_CONA1|nr:uncharacterized protein W97_03332 [Coniosporium apollinis CBS 100218]EON64102.1 hypothetical protein W97_03332 [Coniosporium apollinis CBS 100218]
MASAFIGLTVLVTLRHPPNTSVQGVVANVIPETATLLLQNAFYTANGYYPPGGIRVEGTQIADLEVKSGQPEPSVPAHAHVHPPLQQDQGSLPSLHPLANVPNRTSSVPAAAASVGVPQQRQAFVDPAILSYGKRPTGTPAKAVNDVVTQAIPRPQEAPATPVKHLAAAAAAALPSNTSPFVGEARRPSQVRSAEKRRGDAAATLTAPFSGMDLGPADEVLDDTDEPTVIGGSVRRASLTKTRSGLPMDMSSKPGDTMKRTRRGGKGKRRGSQHGAFPGGNDAEALESSPEVARKAGPNGNLRGKGWRQTPILQDEPTMSPRTPGVIGGRIGREAVTSSNRKTRRQQAVEATNGWATEDATDVQELPEFDFEANLSKFDKRTVFNQIRNEDTTADEDRLVSHNRLPPARPGTYGGKNLHPTENVLDKPTPRGRSDDFTSTEEDDSDFDSGRVSRRSASRASMKRPPYRSGSGVQDEPLPPVPTSGSFSGSLPTALLNRSNRTLTRTVYSPSHLSNSPKPSAHRPTPPMSPSLLSQPATGHATLRLASTDRICNTITPGGMQAVEEAAEIEYGLTEDIMAENSARGIAEVALSAINPGGRRLARETLALNAKPVIVVLAGNHRSGARATAAARHLHARGPRVMVCVLGYERQADWDKDLRRQVALFRAMGGLVKGWETVKSALRKLDAPPELIVDALLGRGREFEALGAEDRATTMECVGWANKSRAQVLAVEGPSGVNGSTGEVGILEGEPFEIRANHVVSLGAPRVGLLRALEKGHGLGDPLWHIWVVDIGINRPWRTHGPSPGGLAGLDAKKGRGIRFGSEWVVGVRFEKGDGLG